MEMDNSQDRWTIDGNCKLCRRSPYCKKPCKLNKKRREALITGVINKHLLEGFSAVADTLGEYKTTEEEQNKKFREELNDIRSE